ncbi:TPA: hypothetical protein NER77_006356, partial [Pseudomonas aeruginosa]|nr:hypothetical protein [Pseudomonas aeruginosa]HCE0993917.1 hypothetical protein [Pseudomonas aeruginosa]HCE3946392.1 hypothetical protein [Pseudomonas aeruginosa]
MADTSKPWEEFASQQPVTGGEKPWEEFGGETKEEGRGLIGHARDLGLSVAKGVIGVPEAAVGLADIPTEGRVGKFLENQDGMLGFRPREAKDFLSDLHTDQYKQQQQDFQDADGVVDKTLHAVQNPSMIVNTVAESLPSMLAGGAVGRGVRALAPALAPVAAGAAGEGAVMAGQQAEQIRQETDDGLLTPAQSGAAVATGVLGSLFSLAGGSLAKKLGIGDADTLLAGGANPGQLVSELASMPAKSIPRKVIEGAISEGFLEELPQSASEQVLQNLALGRDWASGLDEAMVMGTLAGMAMGGPAAVLHGGQPAASRGLADADATFESTPGLEGQTETTAPLALPAPVYEAGSDGQVRTTVDQNSATQAQRQQEAERLDRIRRGEVTDVTPVPAAPKRSEQMGLDPAVGPLSGAAAQAVDSGATDQMVQQAVLQQAAEEAQKSGRKGDQVNPETGEITAEQGDLLASDPVTDLQGRLEFVRRQARATGWDAKKIAERDRLQEELDKLAPAPDAGYMQRVGERVKRIEAAQSPDEIAAILAEDQQDEQRHQNAAGRVELAARARGFALDQAAQQQAPTPIGVQDDIQQAQGKADAQQAQAAQPAVSLAPAAESVPAAPATGAKATNLKDAISKVRQAKQKPEQPAALQAVRRGEVGGKLGSGEVVTTSSGRQTTPFPKVSVDSSRKATSTIKAVDQWLMQNALDEARSRGDEFNARQFEANLAKPQRADKDAAEEYLFGQQPAVQPRVLKPLAPKSTATDNSASWVIRNKETGEVIAETFDRKKVDALNTEKYEAVPIQQHLASLNKPKVPSIEGKDIGEGWAEFSKESGTVGIPRADMPQIKAEHRGAMVNFLSARGVQHQEETVPADTLKPTQAEFSRDKVAKAKDFEGGNRSILVSREGNVLDGHHQWMAARDNGEEVRVIRLDAPIRDLVKLAHEFPSSTTDASSGQGATVDARQVRSVPEPAAPDVPKKRPRGVLAKRFQAEAQARAEYFTPGNVVRGYGANYDRVISYNPTESGSWTVTVRSVRKEGDTWVDVPGESERTHMTAPDARDMKRGPAGRIATQGAPTADEFPLKEAAASYSGISNSSSQRAKSDADEFQTYIDVARDAGAVVARTDAQQAAVEQATRELRADYLAQYRRLMNVRAGTYSGYVVGRSGLNSKQADRRNSAYDRAIDTFVAWQKANQDRVRQAALDARTDEEKAADRQAAEQARADKAQRKEDGDRSLMRRILSWKKGSEPVAITKAAHLAGVNFGKDGYPTSIKLTPTDGSVLTSDKFDLAALFRERGMSVPESKRRVRELVDFVRAEDAARPESEPAEAPKPEPAQPNDSKTPTLDAHVALMQRARSGEATADEFRQAFERTQNARDALVAELGTMKKDDLLKSGGYSFFHRYRNEKKAAIVDALAGRVLEEFALGRSYGPSSYVMSAAGLEAHRQAKASALAELVANTTDDDIKAHAAEVAEAQ